MRNTEDKVRQEIEDEVEELLGCVEDLRKLLSGTRERTTGLEVEREETLQEQWRLKKELAALKRMGNDYDELAAEYEHLRKRQGQVREGLKRLLTHTRALMSEFRP